MHVNRQTIFQFWLTSWPHCSAPLPPFPLSYATSQKCMRYDRNGHEDLIVLDHHYVSCYSPVYIIANKKSLLVSVSHFYLQLTTPPPLPQPFPPPQPQIPKIQKKVRNLFLFVFRHLHWYIKRKILWHVTIYSVGTGWHLLNCIIVIWCISLIMSVVAHFCPFFDSSIC